MANVGFKGISVRQTGTALLFRSFLVDSSGAPLATGTTTLYLYELQSDGTLKSYDFSDNTFKTTALSTETLSLTHRTGNNGTTATGLWTAPLATLTGFTSGAIYLVRVRNTTAVPVNSWYELQYGSEQGDVTVTAASTGVGYVQSDVLEFKGQPVVLDVNNYPGVNIVDVAGSAATVVTPPPTAAQIATAVWQDTTPGDFTVTSSPGSILSTQLGGAFTTTSSSVFSSSALANAPTGGASAASIASAVWQDVTSGDFTVSGSIGKSLFTGGIAPGASGGHFIAGTNAATAITTALTANITGNISGSVGSVTGTVGSVSGNIGGNVNGSVGSVVSGVNTTHFGGQAVVLDGNNYPSVNVVDIKGAASAGSVGHVGLDWGQIANPSSANTFSGTSIGSVSGSVGGNVNGSVGTVVGGVTVTTNNDKTGYTLTVTPPTAAQVATTVWQDATSGDFTVAGSIGKSLFTGGSVPGAAGGLFIAGTNAATSITTALTTNIAGNLTGSVGSVTGSVGSLTTNNDKTGYTLTVTPPTAVQVATAVWQDTTAGDFSVASSIGKSLFTGGNVPGTSGGLFIAGTNAATSITTALTANITGNISGSVGSVTGAVGSVTGSVGSVSGNVGGNVVGSVGSVTAGVNVTQFGGHAVVLDSNNYPGVNVVDISGSAAGALPTAAQVATAVWQDATPGDFTATGSIGKSLFTGGAVPGTANGLFVAGSNAATSASTFTTTFTGNLTGSVGSVTGAVGSVTGGVTVTTNNDKTGYALSATGLDVAKGWGTFSARQSIQAMAQFLFGKRSGVPITGSGGTVTYVDNASTSYGTITVDTSGDITTSAMTPPA